MFYNTDEGTWTSFYANVQDFGTTKKASGAFIHVEVSKVRYFRVESDEIKPIYWEYIRAFYFDIVQIFWQP